MSYPKLTPIIAKGATEPRYLEDRFSDIINVKDYGAKGDGVTNDKAAFTAAFTASKEYSNGKVFVPKGTYFVSVDGYERFDFASLYGDGEIKLSTGHVLSVKNILDSPSLVQCVQGELDWITSGIVPQDISFCDGYVFVSTNRSGDSFDADTVTRITQFPLSLNPDYEWDIVSNENAQTHVDYADITGIGHGEGCQAIKINGQIYIFSEVSESTQNSNGGDGYAVIEWHGSETTSAHVRVVRGVKDMWHAQISVSPDGSLVLFGRNNVSEEEYHADNAFAQTVLNQRVSIFSRRALEEAYELGGESAVSQIDPLYEIYIPKSRRISGRSGIATDGRAVYVLTTDDYVTCDQKILIYSFDGTLLRDINIDAFVSASPEYFFYGYTDSSSKKWYPIRKEAEGLVFYKESLYIGARVDYTKRASAVKFLGRNYITGGNPYDSSNNIKPITDELTWVPTKDAISAGDYNPSYSGYSAPTAFKHHTYLISVSPLGVFNREYPLDITSWVPFELELYSRNRVNIASSNGNEIVLGTYYPNIEQFMRMFTLNKYGQLRIFNVDDAIQNTSNRNGFGFLKCDTNDGCLSVHADENTVADGATNLYMYGARNSGSVGYRFMCGGNTVLDINKSGNTVAYGHVIPSADGGKSLGLSSFRWDVVYATTGSINTSDKREKSNVADIPENVVEAWGNIGFKAFQYNSAIEEKGQDAARIHFGVVAQDVDSVFAESGIDARRFGLFCYDEWDDQYTSKTIVDEEEHVDEESGDVIPEKTHVESSLVMPAGNRFGIRYEEALILECAYLRSRISKMQEQIDILVERINQLTNNVNN